MNKIFKIFLTDARRISTNVVAVVIILGLSILPSLYAWFNIFSNWDPYGPDSTGNVKVAVISADKGAEIAGMELNIGNSVIEGLEANRTIGWVFTDSVEDTIEGVEKGDYYAALVIPESFTEDMVSFLNGEIEHPMITYYENDKKNAIAPKITQKAWKAVKQQVNASFISTLAESFMKAGNVISKADTDGNTIAYNMTSRLESLDENMQDYINILYTFNSIMSSAQGLIDSTTLMLPNLEMIMSTSKTSLSSMQSVLNTSQASIDTISGLMNSSLDMIESSLNMASNVIETDLAAAGAVSDTMVKSLGMVSTLVDYTCNLYDTSVSGIEATANDATKAQLQATRESLMALKNDTDKLGQSSAIAVANNKALVNNIQSEINGCKDSINSLKNSYNNDVKPKLTSAINSSKGALNTTINTLSKLDADFSGIEDVLGSYSDSLEMGNEGLGDTLILAEELLEDVHKLVENVTNLEDNENYNKLMNIIDTNPEELGEFVASPVELETVRIFPIENYGSAMAPFYTVLGLWVGALILVAIIHVHVHEIEGLEFKPRHAYFGRYIVFFLVGQVQTLITVFGDLFFIQIQCEEPFLFWLAASVSSFVFTIFIYSLTVAFGNIGEALAIIVMVIQVAGAGCTFPIETLPKVFHYIYDYLPFQFAMNALKECVGGLYGSDYWGYLGGLVVYVFVSLFIGLVMAIPFRKLNEVIERSKKRSGIMI